MAREKAQKTSTMISARIDGDLVHKIGELCVATRMSRSLIINAALHHFLSCSEEEKGQIIQAYYLSGQKPPAKG